MSYGNQENKLYQILVTNLYICSDKAKLKLWHEEKNRK